MGALGIPTREIEMPAIAAVAGAAAATAAAAFRWAASVGWVVGSAVAEAEGDTVLEAVATMFLDTAASLSGERPTAGILASRRRQPIAETSRLSRLRFSLLPPLCSAFESL